ncbi:hypothetical protein [Methylotenera sp.]|uniref:hypothetical protein n=1 Tax=Methylotenera sp. TaxID=2051956 RepID=UPI00248873E4|nr:hypothetical protein [Methylotenera sp.]MDI1362565.1 hypothetical protein [Methylotenera sp.]
MKTKPNKPTKLQLLRENLELKAQMAHAYHFATASIDRTSTKHLMASGVLLQLSGIGGKELIHPVMIKDGLSDETIAAIKADLKRSYDLAVMFKV